MPSDLKSVTLITYCHVSLKSNGLLQLDKTKENHGPLTASPQVKRILAVKSSCLLDIRADCSQFCRKYYCLSLTVFAVYDVSNDANCNMEFVVNNTHNVKARLQVLPLALGTKHPTENASPTERSHCSFEGAIPHEYIRGGWLSPPRAPPVIRIEAVS